MAKTDTLHIRIEPSVKARAEQTLIKKLFKQWRTLKTEKI